MDRATFSYCTAFFRDLGNSPPSALPGVSVGFIDDAEGSFGYSDFFRDFLLPNRPCLFSASFTRDWPSRRTWVTPEGKPNFQHLLREFGDAVVPVARCDLREYNSHPKEQLPFKEFLEYWRESGGSGSSRGCLYLKDWHLSRAFPQLDFYTTPAYFSSDWLNEYWDAAGADDFRFVYMGPKGSWTPFHADVFRSYSWSANVCGRKRWLLFPPGHEEFLRDRRGNLPFDVTAPLDPLDPLDPGGSRRIPAPLEILQEPGQILFVPSGWHHQVHNLEDTISINHNWVNGCNVAVMWSFLQAELAAVQREIGQWGEPVDDWHLQCQLILKSCAGIDYREFFTFLRAIAERRLRLLERESPARGNPPALEGESASRGNPPALERESPSRGNPPATLERESPSWRNPPALERESPSRGNPPTLERESPSRGNPPALERESPSRGNPPALGTLHALFDLQRALAVLGSLSANEDFNQLDLSWLAPPPEVLLQRLEAAVDSALL